MSAHYLQGEYNIELNSLQLHGKEGT